MAAGRSNRSMRSAPAYRTNGAAAYKYEYQTGTAAPKREPKRSPKQHPKKRQKAKVAVAPFAILGMLAVSLMLLLVIGGYVQLYEATNEVGDLNSQLRQLQIENERLQSIYDEKVDLNAIETAAMGLGMHMPNRKQTIYLDLNGRDSAEILTVQKDNIFREIYEAITSSAKSLIEYFR